MENKQLRQKLRRFEELHCWHLEKEKLFEVRTRLPAHKKRELEKALLYVAATLGAAPDDAIVAVNLPPIDIASRPVAMSKPSSSSTSLSRPVDSTYASLSASGKTSASHRQLTERLDIAGVAHESGSKPIRARESMGLGLQEPVELSERAKKKLVVRRMEQLFTGNNGRGGRHGPSLQQQKLTRHLPAWDRKSIEAKVPWTSLEGTREATIIPAASEAQGHEREPDQIHLRTTSPGIPAESQPETVAPAERKPSVQRPTRLFDLDPYRVQNAEDNIQYIRHLGVDISNTDGSSTTSNAEGWIFLNLLTSMAQLHTLSITADFVRDALAEFSEKFELSSDGGKVRWTGGQEYTRFSSDAESLAHRESESPSEELPSPFSSATHGVATSHDMDSEKSQEPSRGVPVNPTSRSLTSRDSVKHQKELRYAPLFFHGGQSDGEHKHWGHQTNSALSSGRGDDGPSSLAASVSVGNGPIIFYSRTTFCTDLSGDSGLSLLRGSTYHSANLGAVLGISGSAGHFESCIGERKGPLSLSLADGIADAANPKHDSKNDNTLSLSEEEAWGSMFNDEKQSVLLEASGIGGVLPCDNFVVHVSVTHQKVLRASRSPILPRTALARSVLGSRLQADDGWRISSRISHQEQHLLSTSMLPPPSFFAVASASSDGEADESDAQMDSVDMSPSAGSSRPVPMPRLVSRPTRQYPQLNDDGPLFDMLAGVRRLDSATMTAGGTSLESDVAMAFAREIPTGRSASTSGTNNVSFMSDSHDVSTSLSDGSREQVEEFA